MDLREPKEKPIELPDVVVEHGSTRLSLDLTAIEWICLTLIVAIVGMIVYLVK